MGISNVESLLKRLRTLRVRSGLTQEQFAEASGISYKYYQAVEAGRKRDLRLSTLERLAKAHRMEIWQLLRPDFAPDEPEAEPTRVTRRGKRR